MQKLNTIKFSLCLLRGLWRLYWGCCPQCNSDAPDTFSCDVCAYGGVPDRHWQNRWLDKLRDKYL